MTDPEDRFRVVDTETLGVLAQKGHAQQYNRTISREELKRLDPNGVHLLEAIMIHNDDHFRAWLLMKEKDSMEPIRVLFDISIPDYEHLLSVTQYKALVAAMKEI